MTDMLNDKLVVVTRAGCCIDSEPVPDVFDREAL